MLYFVIIKKPYGFKSQSPLLDVVRNYVSKFGKNDFILVLPGYMSTNITTADNFANKFPQDITKVLAQNNAYFFEGMNGKKPIGGLSKTNVQDYINSKYGSLTSSKFYSCQDHSKVSIFSEKDQHDSLDEHIGKIIEGKVKIKAIAIGSSNYSDTTLTHIPPSSKGECDVFIIDSDLLSNLTENSIKKMAEKIKGYEWQVSISKEIESNFTLNELVLDYIQKKID